jgi:hypothetical protein
MRPKRRQVSWLAGPHPSPPSRGIPVAEWQGLAAYSCGGSCGLGTLFPHRIPCSLSLERPSMAVLNGCGRLLSTQACFRLREVHAARRLDHLCRVAARATVVSLERDRLLIQPQPFAGSVLHGSRGIGKTTSQYAERTKRASGKIVAMMDHRAIAYCRGTYNSRCL